MQILYLHQYFVPRSGSGGTRSYEFARRLVERGHAVRMITTSARIRAKGQADAVEVQRIDGIEVVILPVPYSNEMRPHQRVLAFIRFCWLAILQIAKERNYDVVFATSTPLTIIIPAVFAKWWRWKPLVFEVRDLWPTVPIALGYLRSPLARLLTRRLEKFAYQQSRRIVALSPGMRDGIVSVCPAKAGDVEVIPNACDVDLFGASSTPPKEWLSRYSPLGSGRRIILYPGTLGHVNGTGYLVGLAHELMRHDSDCCIVIFGEGIEKQAVEDMARRAGVLGSNFFLYAPVPKPEIAWALERADLCVSTVIDNKALWDNSANKFFDALAASRPIAINHEGWQAEIIRKYGCGLVLHPTDMAEAARQVSQFLGDEARVKAARQSAASLAIEQFARDKLSDRFVHLLEAAASSAASQKKGGRFLIVPRQQSKH